MVKERTRSRLASELMVYHMQVTWLSHPHIATYIIMCLLVASDHCYLSNVIHVFFTQINMHIVNIINEHKAISLACEYAMFSPDRYQMMRQGNWQRWISLPLRTYTPGWQTSLSTRGSFLMMAHQWWGKSRSHWCSTSCAFIAQPEFYWTNVCYTYM